MLWYYRGTPVSWGFIRKVPPVVGAASLVKGRALPKRYGFSLFYWDGQARGKGHLEWKLPGNEAQEKDTTK